jgi:AraC-like DNA-binding protein
MQNALSTRLAALIESQARGVGFLPSSVPGVVLMRMDRHLPQAPTVYEPCVVLVAQGRKVGSCNGRTYVCDARHGLAMTVPLPFLSETFGSATQPFLGLALTVTPALVTELLLQMDDAPPPAADDVIATFPLNDDVLTAGVRLLEAMRQDERARVLGPGVVRELIYLLLRGPAGAALRALAVGDTRTGRIAKVIQRLQTEFAAHHDLPALAREAGMSPSTFHARFKKTTGESPLQYLKLIRLHRARELMVNEGLSAQAAAFRVGYESATQFSREFKRVFGASPGVVVQQLRAQLRDAQQPRLRATLSFAGTEKEAVAALPSSSTSGTRMAVEN